MNGLLEGRRILVTGVLTESSIAYAVARRAQRLGTMRNGLLTVKQTVK